MFSDNKDAVTYAWNLMGFVAKLSQGVSILCLVFSGIHISVTLGVAWPAYVMSF